MADSDMRGQERQEGGGLNQSINQLGGQRRRAGEHACVTCLCILHILSRVASSLHWLCLPVFLTSPPPSQAAKEAAGMESKQQ